jgi:uncharacterized protein YcgI (DUF1989 family)
MTARMAGGCSKPGDYIEFEALMDCVVALSNCPFYRGTPMKVELFDGAQI